MVISFGDSTYNTFLLRKEGGIEFLFPSPNRIFSSFRKMFGQFIRVKRISCFNVHFFFY